LTSQERQLTVNQYIEQKWCRQEAFPPRKGPSCAAVDMVPIEKKGFIVNLVMDSGFPRLR
jgi:hypothetical protein